MGIRSVGVIATIIIFPSSRVLNAPLASFFYPSSPCTTTTTSTHVGSPHLPSPPLQVDLPAVGPPRSKYISKKAMQAAPPYPPAPVAKKGGGGHKTSSGSSSSRSTKLSSSTVPTLVLDNGADRLKVGFAGEPSPRFLIPNCTAKLKGQVQVLLYVVCDYTLHLFRCFASLRLYSLTHLYT